MMTVRRGSVKQKQSARVSPNIMLHPAKEKERKSFTEGLSDLSNLSILAPSPPMEDVREEQRRGEISYFSSEIMDPAEQNNTDNIEENENITLP